MRVIVLLQLALQYTQLLASINVHFQYKTVCNIQKSRCQSLTPPPVSSLLAVTTVQASSPQSRDRWLQNVLSFPVPMPAYAAMVLPVRLPVP